MQTPTPQTSDTPVKIGIVICDRYRRCSGGKCLRALRDKEGAFRLHPATAKLELVGFATCDGCPGGNVEYLADEMVKNGATVIHLATGMVVGYPPCPFIANFIAYLENKYPVRVIVGTHPIPNTYLRTHTELGTWQTANWMSFMPPLLCDEITRARYD